MEKAGGLRLRALPAVVFAFKTASPFAGLRDLRFMRHLLRNREQPMLLSGDCPPPETGTLLGGANKSRAGSCRDLAVPRCFVWLLKFAAGRRFSTESHAAQAT